MIPPRPFRRCAPAAGIVVRLITRVVAPLLAPLLALSLVPGAAAAQDADGLTWIVNRYEPFEAGDIGVSVLYGLPQSDFLVLSARCETGGGRPSVALELAVDPGPLPEGAPVLVDFGIPGNPALASLPGRVVGLDREVGIAGAALDVPADHRLWSIFGAANRVTFGIRSIGPGTEIAGDASAALPELLSACREAGGLAAVPPPAATALPLPVAGT
ncbi:hypothetical protein HKCCE2091_04400, partial [Rhodobacterales bacterium HKCCE2091]|nr:hypothetical protein [Rhodobacterales bacterium HKCCE2091]